MLKKEIIFICIFRLTVRSDVYGFMSPEMKDRFHVQILFFFLEITSFLKRKSRNSRQIQNEDVFLENTSYLGRKPRNPRTIRSKGFFSRTLLFRDEFFSYIAMLKFLVKVKMLVKMLKLNCLVKVIS